METFVKTFAVAVAKGLIASTLPVIVTIVAWLASGCSFHLIVHGLSLEPVPVASIFLFLLMFVIEIVVAAND
jgi:hypothetical protein